MGTDTTLYYWDHATSARVVVTADYCRDMIAQIQTELDETAFLPDVMRVGRRNVSSGGQASKLQARLALWESRLYTLTGGTEGKRPGCAVEHV